MNNHHRSPLGNSSLASVRSGTFEQQWQNKRVSLVRFLQTSDFPAIGEGDLKLVLILINTGPKDQILTMTLTAPQSVIVYAENTTHKQGETVES